MLSHHRHRRAGSSPTSADPIAGDLRLARDAVDADRLSRAVAELARAASSMDTGSGIEKLLRDLCEVAAQALSADGAGVASVSGQRTHFVHNDEPLLHPLAEVQEAMQVGPCTDCVVSGVPVMADDLTAEARWPAYTAVAREVGMAAVLAVPLRSRGRTWGTLDLYRRTPGAWSEEQIDAAQLLASVAVSYVVMAADRHDALRARAELVHRSTHDQLTGLPNRSLLFDRMEHALASADRRGTVVGVLFIDLDGFKDINDTFGHAAGDVVLTEVARRLTAILRQGDSVCRLAGDEFVLLCEDLPAGAPLLINEITHGVTKRIRAALAEPIQVGGADLSVSASIGAAVAAGDPSPEELLHEADTAMYRAKEEGRGRVSIRDHTFGVGNASGRRLQRELVGALDLQQLRVHYQPVVDAGGAVSAVEALLRWDHPEHGMLHASEFIAMAESTGLMPSIGREVLRTSCLQMSQWQAEFPADAPQRVFVNLSARELTDPTLPRMISDALDEASLAPEALGLEVVESSFADPQVLPLLDELRRDGHDLAVDDFGTGYSSLSRLVKLPVSYAKIDRSFVSGLPTDDRSRALVDAVLCVADRLDLQVIAEGIENQAQADHLRDAGCHYLQGYHLGTPRPGADITEMLEQAV